MFESFSPKFESGFRIFFIVWVCIWSSVDIFQLLIKYATFSTISQAEQGRWLFDILGAVIGLTTGILLLFYMSGISSTIKKSKKVGGIALWIMLVVFYYLFKTFTNILGLIIFAPDKISTEFIGLIGWFIPSIVVLVMHVLYFVNIMKYREELEEKIKKGLVAAQ